MQIMPIAAIGDTNANRTVLVCLARLWAHRSGQPGQAMNIAPITGANCAFRVPGCDQKTLASHETDENVHRTIDYFAQSFGAGSPSAKHTLVFEVRYSPEK